MKILILSSNLSNEAGGYSQSSFILRDSLEKFKKNETFLFGFWISKFFNLDFKLTDKINIFSNNFLNIFPFSFHFFKKITSIKPDIIEVQGLWNSASIFSYIYHKITSTPYIITPRGMLEPWALKKSFFKKLLFHTIFGQFFFKNSSCIKATSFLEAKNIRNLFKKVKIVIIPNAVEIPKLKMTFKNKKKKFKLLFFGRYDEKKGISELLNAWFYLQKKHTNWELIFYGYDNKYKKQMQNLSNSLGLKRVQWNIFANAKDRKKIYTSSDLFVLPTHSENFGLVIAESLVHGLPVITTQNTPWLDINKKKCGWCIKLTIKKLVETMDHAMKLSAKERFLMGQRGRRWIVNDFNSEVLAAKTQRVYEWILKKKPKPKGIVFN